MDLCIHLIEVEQCIDLVKVPEEERNQKSAILQLKHKQQCSFNIEVSHHQANPNSLGPVDLWSYPVEVTQCVVFDFLVEPPEESQI